MVNRLTRSIVLIAAVFMLSSFAFAQEFEIYGPSAQGQRTPASRQAAAKATPPAYTPHDLSGLWWGARNSPLMGNPLPSLTAWGKAQYETHHPSRGPRAVVPALTDDPMAHCDPLGYPRNLYIDTRSYEFIQLPNKIVQIFEWAHGTREIYTEQPHPPARPQADPPTAVTARGRLNGAMANIEDFGRLVAADRGLVVVSVTRTDGTISSSVVNAGVLPHPVTGATVVGMVIRGGTRKLAYLRERPYANVVIRSGWQWAAAEGAVDLIGPDDPEPSVDSERLRLLLREVFTAAGGTHDDFGTYDRVMRDERRTAVFVHPSRVYANPGQ